MKDNSVLRFLSKNVKGLLIDIFASFRSLPTWVQVWVAVILFPVNLAAIFFIHEPMGLMIATLSTMGWLPNVFILARERGFSRLMALPHLIPWTLLIVVIYLASPSLSSGFDIYLWLLAIVNTISITFDTSDSIRWYNGQRQVFSSKTNRGKHEPFNRDLKS